VVICALMGDGSRPGEQFRCRTPQAAEVKRIFCVILFLFISTEAFAEGGCPPGQYPVGGQGVQGCAPIPQSGSAIPASRPTGKWETRWGAIARDFSPTPGARLAIGVAESQRTKKDASAVALAQCAEGGGNDCRVLLAYNNQCAALSGPVVSDLAAKGGITYAAGAPGIEEAKANSMRSCQGAAGGQRCTVVYSACSMAEFKSFR
jgi:hypothetical protein